MSTTTQRNAALVRRGYEAFNSADMPTLAELFDPSAIWHTPGRGPLAGDYHGRDAIFGQFGRYGMETHGTFRATLLHVFESDDGRVVGLHHNSAERDSKRLDVDCCIVFALKDGRIIEGREHFFDLYAWDEFSGRSRTGRVRRPHRAVEPPSFASPESPASTGRSVVRSGSVRRDRAGRSFARGLDPRRDRPRHHRREC